MHITPSLVHFCRLPSQFLTSNIAVTLILEHACLSYASQHDSDRDEALDGAYSRYTSSDFHNEVPRHFSAPPTQYSVLQFTEFILEHRLSWFYFLSLNVSSAIQMFWVCSIVILSMIWRYRPIAPHSPGPSCAQNIYVIFHGRDCSAEFHGLYTSRCAGERSPWVQCDSGKRSKKG